MQICFFSFLEESNFFKKIQQEINSIILEWVFWFYKSTLIILSICQM